MTSQVINTESGGPTFKGAWNRYLLQQFKWQRIKKYFKDESVGNENKTKPIYFFCFGLFMETGAT